MKTSLTQGLNEEEAKIVEAEFKRCPTLRRRLQDLLESRANAIMKSMLDETILVEPNFPILQAQRAAKATAMLNLKSLLEN